MQSFHWKNAQGIELYGCDWQVPAPKAVIALVHGQGEHIGRFAHVAEWFNQHQIALIGFDQQGYGQSGGLKGHADNFDVLLDDIGQFLDHARSRYPGLPLFLYGHSMGGGLALCYLLQRKPAITAAIITSPWIRLAFEAPAIKVIAGKLLRRFMPTLRLPTGLSAHFISHDPAVVKAYKEDPLVHDKLSAAAGIALLEGFDWLNKYEGRVDIPLLVMHGGGDKITSAAASKSFSQRVKGAVNFHEWPGLYHEMHNEPEKQELFNYTLNWMEQQL